MTLASFMCKVSAIRDSRVTLRTRSGRWPTLPRGCCRGRLLTALLMLSVLGLLPDGPAHAQPATTATEALAAARSGDFARAFEIWQPMAEGGDALAQYNLGVLHERGLGVPQDESQAMWWYLKSAAQGYAWAAYNLAGQFRDGRGVPRPEPAEAARWYREAAEGGVPDAAWVLARSEQDPAMTRRWLEQAARGGHAEAQLAFAERLLAEGGDDATVRREALLWAEKAHAAGNRASCALRARAMAEGWSGQPADVEAAAGVLRSGAESGDAACQRRLGLAYGRGEGVVQDYGQAVFWYTRAARAGDEEAQYLLALSFRLGRGLVPSLPQAWAWCRLAAERGYAPASEALPLMEEDIHAIPGEADRAAAVLAEIRTQLRPEASN
jgi:uncharacterized protein